MGATLEHIWSLCEMVLRIVVLRASSLFYNYGYDPIPNETPITTHSPDTYYMYVTVCFFLGCAHIHSVFTSYFHYGEARIIPF